MARFLVYKLLSYQVSLLFVGYQFWEEWAVAQGVAAVLIMGQSPHQYISDQMGVGSWVGLEPNTVDVPHCHCAGQY